jgi:hypothetical protein
MGSFITDNINRIKLEYTATCEKLKQVNNKIECYSNGATPFPVDESIYRQLNIKASMLENYKAALKETAKSLGVQL